MWLKINRLVNLAHCLVQAKEDQQSQASGDRNPLKSSFDVASEHASGEWRRKRGHTKLMIHIHLWECFCGEAVSCRTGSQRFYFGNTGRHLVGACEGCGGETGCSVSFYLGSDALSVSTILEQCYLFLGYVCAFVIRIFHRSWCLYHLWPVFIT